MNNSFVNGKSSLLVTLEQKVTELQEILKERDQTIHRLREENIQLSSDLDKQITKSKNESEQARRTESDLR